MAESSFPGTNPFGGGGSFNPTAQATSIREETEDPADTISPQTAGGGKSPFGSFNPPGAGSAFRPTQLSSADPNDPSLPRNYNYNRRTSVSAESLTPTSNSQSDPNWKPPYHAKTPEQLSRLRSAVSANFLFSHLDDDNAHVVLGALVEKPIPAKDIKVITQGDAGDYFYVVEKGTFDIYVNPAGHVEPGKDGMGNKVNSIGPGGSFGELALMYNAPRAATVVSTEANSTLWALDRVTFRRILMDSAFQRRRMYESFLEEVPLLSTLTLYERSKIADALDTQKFRSGATIIREGDPGEAFYILESGEAAAYKSDVGDGKEVIKRYKKGDYFGELALLDDKPRAASVVATRGNAPTATGDEGKAATEGGEGDGEVVKVAYLGKQGFQRLLGPVEGIMRRNDYAKKEEQKT